MYETRQTTRSSHEVNGLEERREVKKNPKYLYDYETTEIQTTRNRRIRNDDSIVENRTIEEKGRTRRESNENKENKENHVTNERSNGKLKEKKEKAEEVKKEDADSNETKSSKENDTKQGSDGNKKDVKPKIGEYELLVVITVILFF